MQGEKKLSEKKIAGITLEEVAKHTTKEDCWVVVNGDVLNVTNFLSEHPGGELAILTFAGKDATEEFNMIHPPDVVGKYSKMNNNCQRRIHHDLSSGWRTIFRM
jgi:cytochrome b involved in lipid metabolism